MLFVCLCFILNCTPTLAPLKACNKEESPGLHPFLSLKWWWRQWAGVGEATVCWKPATLPIILQPLHSRSARYQTVNLVQIVEAIMEILQSVQTNIWVFCSFIGPLPFFKLTPQVNKGENQVQHSCTVAPGGHNGGVQVDLFGRLKDTLWLLHNAGIFLDWRRENLVFSADQEASKEEVLPSQSHKRPAIFQFMSIHLYLLLIYCHLCYCQYYLQLLYRIPGLTPSKQQWQENLPLTGRNHEQNQAHMGGSSLWWGKRGRRRERTGRRENRHRVSGVRGR